MHFDLCDSLFNCLGNQHSKGPNWSEKTLGMNRLEKGKRMSSTEMKKNEYEKKGKWIFFLLLLTPTQKWTTHTKNKTFHLRNVPFQAIPKGNKANLVSRDQWTRIDQNHNKLIWIQADQFWVTPRMMNSRDIGGHFRLINCQSIDARRIHLNLHAISFPFPSSTGHTMPRNCVRGCSSNSVNENSHRIPALVSHLARPVVSQSIMRTNNHSNYQYEATSWERLFPCSITITTTTTTTGSRKHCPKRNGKRRRIHQTFLWHLLCQGDFVVGNWLVNPLGLLFPSTNQPTNQTEPILRVEIDKESKKKKNPQLVVSECVSLVSIVILMQVNPYTLNQPLADR